MVIPAGYGLVLKKLELLPGVEVHQLIEERADKISFSVEEIDQLVYEASESNT